jgi:hypothetical protein
LPNQESPVPVDKTGKPLIKLIVDISEYGRVGIESLDIDGVQFLTLSGLESKSVQKMMISPTLRRTHEIFFGKVQDLLVSSILW